MARLLVVIRQESSALGLLKRATRKTPYSSFGDFPSRPKEDFQMKVAGPFWINVCPWAGYKQALWGPGPLPRAAWGVEPPHFALAEVPFSW
jgi:hypothetical protein